MKTLVDCGCETKVHKDGSGVEVYYCPLHEAAPELAKALRDSYTQMAGLAAYLETCAVGVIIENLATTITVLQSRASQAEAALKKAGLL